MASLHTKYRPRNLDEFAGQDHVVIPLKKLIESKRSQAFVFSGPSGVGKTTLARIAARMFGCDVPNISAIDAATNSGADAMRAITEMAQHRAFNETGVRAIIIDECQSLSKQAWQSLLNALEEPPPHAFWFLCTTEPGKVPVTTKTRCSWFTLKPLPDDKIRGIITFAAVTEKMRMRDDVIEAIVSAANGSARQALVYLAHCDGAKSAAEADERIEGASASPEAVDLCRILISGRASWQEVMPLLPKLAERGPESVRIIVCNYFGKAILGSKSQKSALPMLHVLDCFSQSYNQSDGVAPLLLSIGKTIFNRE